METCNSIYRTFSYTADALHVVHAKHRASNALVGELAWSEPKGLVEYVTVSPDHSGAGVEDLMWAEAKRYSVDNTVAYPYTAKKK